MNALAPTVIRPKDRDTVLQALRAGVVPRAGLQLIQVGRAREVQSLVSDLDRVADSGSAFRVIVGDYGAGKTFFLTLVRAIAHEKGLVTAHADLNPDRRLHGAQGQARSFYQELMRNLATRTKPDAAMASIVERFISTALQEAKQNGMPVETAIHTRLQSLSELTNGYDFAEVIAKYYQGHDQGNDQLKQDAVRWLRGEFSTKTDARAALGVRSIIDDDDVYDQLKLFARFTRLAGYKGLLVVGDELVNLLKIPHAGARNANYEQLLRMVNDVLQGHADSLGLLFGGTPESLMDPRRGLYSYAALETRLRENAFAQARGVDDTSGPVIRLATLTPEDLYVLLTKLRHVQAGGDPTKYLVPDDALYGFLAHCSNVIGAAYFQTPRQSIRAFLDMLAVLEASPGTSWTDLVTSVAVASDEAPPIDDMDATGPREAIKPVARAVMPNVLPTTIDDDGLSTFRF
ncbi:P-loop uncharacterized protein DUF2791 [Tahibacter aquaticus]|uniref:P-loop uncharacterized protein DUF2791 n=1 Tax=Tahibacter aquaticus TaxID=520092 RepID=A0A4R6YM65_9GAMM|nr:ATP-binding protein [Tahibacter aquaticus]TDR38431.1 P-loop uncharacterized protein DUF2791 [Tahibacter aquaticus]